MKRSYLYGMTVASPNWTDHPEQREVRYFLSPKKLDLPAVLRQVLHDVPSESFFDVWDAALRDPATNRVVTPPLPRDNSSFSDDLTCDAFEALLRAVNGVEIEIEYIAALIPHAINEIRTRYGATFDMESEYHLTAAELEIAGFEGEDDPGDW